MEKECSLKTPKSVKIPNKSTTPCMVLLEKIDPQMYYTKKGKTPNKCLNGYLPCTPKVNVEFSLELKKVINDRNILTSKTKKRVFEALDEIKTSNEQESRRYKRERALLEIINSEIKYVHQLETIIRYFMKPIEERKILNGKDFELLFGDIKTIYNINKELLEHIDQGPDNVANGFLKIAPYFKLYSVYAYNFRNILQFLQKAPIITPEFAKFVENQETRPEVQNKLSALLITPIQRVPRYKLLVTQVFELTSPTEKDYYNLVGCLEKIEDAADHINKIVEDQENAQRLLELQRCIRGGEPNVITPGRRLIKEGILTKMCAKQNEKMYVVLMNDIIMFHKMKKVELKVNSLKCVEIFPLNKCKIIEILDKGSFRIVCQNEEMVLYHENLAETKKWIKHIEEAIANYIEDRKTLRKESSARRPVKRKDMLEYHEVGLSPGRPLKKRKIHDNEAINGTDSPRNTNMIVSRRRPIRSVLSTTFDNFNSKFIESLPKVDIENDYKDNLPKDVFIFGQTRNQSVIGNIFGGIKKFFGFKN